MRTVTATAEGSSQGTPDQLTARLGISNTGASAGAVMADNNRLAQALIARVAELGIADDDVATSSVDIHPEHDRDAKQVGYRANNMLSVRFRDLEAVGEKLDALVDAAGDSIRIDGISLGFNDPEALLSAARIDAVRRARVQADEMAQAAGASVGDVVLITDDLSTGGGFEPRVAFAAGARSVAKASVPIAAGSQELTVKVRVVFELT